MPKDYYFQPIAPDPILSEEKVLSLARQIDFGVNSPENQPAARGELDTLLKEIE